MNKDSVIAAVFGILLGFIAGYLMHEVMATRQPQRFVPGTQGAMPGAQSMPGAGGAPTAPAQPDQSAQMMQEMQNLEAFVQQNPNNDEAIRQLADMNFELQRWPQARDLYTRYLSLKPGDPDVLSDLGVVYRGLGDHDKALAHFDEAQRLAPDHWRSLYNKIIVLVDLRRFDEAQQVMTALEKLQPDNPNVTQLAQELEKQRKAAA